MRGSGRFRRSCTRSPRTAARLNPLHCGAVVASCPHRGSTSKLRFVSIPFIAGQWSLRGARRVFGGGAPHVLIPFIAGQWSLPASMRLGASTSARLNPLHCGAVVASRRRARGPRWKRGSQSPSLRGSGRFEAARAQIRKKIESLNPLHCGAVVASRAAHCRRRRHCDVSIPFIAGQWSLQADNEARSWSNLESQSPSLRGSGRFVTRWHKRTGSRRRSQSPSLRGSGRFLRRALPALAPERVSIPFIAGQWSLHTTLFIRL